jgi:hypothetical protein
MALLFLAEGNTADRETVLTYVKLDVESHANGMVGDMVRLLNRLGPSLDLLAPDH